MDGRVPAAIFWVFVTGFVLIAGCGQAPAAGIADSEITIAGNRHVGADAIRAHFHAATDGKLDAAALDAALKSLYATRLFQDVKFSHDGEHVVVTVVENPTIERIAFEGNKKIKDEDLRKIVQSAVRGPLSRAFVQQDVIRIVDLYRQRGYFEAGVVPKTITAKNGRVDLVFEIKEADKLAVRQVLFAGNGAYAANKLKGVIKTGETNVLSLVLDNDAYDADRIDNDRELLRQFYRGHGYADVRVRSQASYEADKKGVVLTFTLDEGPQYRYGKVEVDSHLKTVDAGGLRPYLRTQPGDIFDAEAINKSVDDLAMQLARNGEPFASVLAQNERLPKERVVNLVYAIDQGKRLYVERIDIAGNIKTYDDVIRREFDVAEGDAYNRALMDRAERRLKQFGYFKTVKIDTQPGSAPDRVVVHVAVEEQRTGDFQISGGYSTSQGALAQISVSDKNLMGAGDTGRVAVTYGQYARSFDVALT